MPCCFVRSRAQPDIDTDDHEAEEPGEMAGKAPVQQCSEEMQFLKKGAIALQGANHTSMFVYVCMISGYKFPLENLGG